MALLYPNNAVFYHPLDNAAEKVHPHNWNFTGARFASAVISSGVTASGSIGRTAGFTIVNPGASTSRAVSAQLSQNTQLLCYFVTGSFRARVISTAYPVVTSGADVTIEGAASFSDAGTISVCALTPSSALVSYAATAPNRAGSRILSISGVTITNVSNSGVFSSNVAARNGLVWNMSSERLDDTTAVVAFSDYSQVLGNDVVVVNASGTTPTFGPLCKVVPSGFNVQNNKVIGYSPTSFGLVYRDSTMGVGRSHVGTVSGMTVTSLGGGVAFTDLAAMKRLSTCVLDDQRFAVLGAHDSTLGVSIGQMSGANIVAGAETLVSAGGDDSSHEVGDRLIGALTPSLLVAGYHTTGTLGRCSAIQVSGLIITSKGAEATYEPANNPLGNIQYPNVVPLDSTNFLLTWRQGGSVGSGVAIIGTCNGTTITYGTRAPYANVPVGLSTDLLVSGMAVSVWRDTGDGNKIKARVLNVSGTNVIPGVTSGVIDTGNATVTYLNRPKVVAINANRALAFYPNAGGSGMACVLAVSGDTITASNLTAFETTLYPNCIAGDRIAPSSALISYVTSSLVSQARRVRVITLGADDTLSIGAAQFIDTGTAAASKSMGLTSTGDVPAVSVFPSGNAFVWATSDVGPRSTNGDGVAYLKTVGLSGTTASGNNNYVMDIHADPSTVGAMRLGSGMLLVSYPATRPYDTNTFHIVAALISGSSFVYGPIRADSPNATSLHVLSPTSMNIAGSGGEPSAFSIYNNSANGRLEARLYNAYGTSGTLGPAAILHTFSDNNISAQSVEPGKNIVFFTSGAISAALHATFVQAAESGSLTSPSGSVYTTMAGSDRFVTAFWGIEPTRASGIVSIIRGYQFEMNDSSIQLSDGVSGVKWNSAPVASAVSGLNDLARGHFLVCDFRNASGNWTLKTSVDGNPYVNQGTQSSGGLTLLATDSAPSIGIVNSWPSNEVRSLDEMVVWGSGTPEFTSTELFRLYGQAAYGNRSLDQYSLYDPVNVSSGMTPIFLWGNMPASGDVPMWMSGVSGSQLSSQSGNCPQIITGHLSSSGDIPMLLCGHMPASGTMPVSLWGNTPASGTMPMFLWGHTGASGSVSMWCSGVPGPISGTIPTWIEGMNPSSGSCSLFANGIEFSTGTMPMAIPAVISDTSGSVALYTQGASSASGAKELFAWGKTIASGSMPMTLVYPSFAIHDVPMFMLGVGSGTRADFTIEELLRTGDHDPQVVARLDVQPPMNVYIQVWDITNGAASPVAITSSGCYAIGDTGRWGWSTQYLPEWGVSHPLYYYRMAGHGESFEGQFFMNKYHARRAYPSRSEVTIVTH